jgi:hypothetical protein
LFVFISGKICGYELSLHKHDDLVDQTSAKIPFTVELNEAETVIKLKSTIDKLDCEIKQTYSLFIRAYDCAEDNQRRYSERLLFSFFNKIILSQNFRSSLLITIDDVNEFVPIFTHKSYQFKLHQDQICTSCRVTR